MLLYLIRHGQSTDNATTAASPDTDEPVRRATEEPATDSKNRAEHPLEEQLRQAMESPLTGMGKRQVELAGAWLANRGITHLYASAMARALQTAEILARHVGGPIRVMPSLCEFRTRAGFTGLARGVLERLVPDCLFPEECGVEGWWDRSIEEEADSYERARLAAESLQANHLSAGDRVAVVTHGLFGSALLSVLLGAPPCGYKRFLMHNAAVSLLEIEPSTTRLSFHNDTCFLPDKLRT